MFLHVDHKSATPVYRQVVDQVKHAVASGRLRPGDALPSIRTLAEQLRINRNTIAKAYGELEHEGVVETQRGRGVFVSEGGSPFADAERRAILTRSIDAAIVQAHHLRYDADALRALVEERLAAFDPDREPQENDDRK